MFLIYFITDGKDIKIGYTKHPIKKRLKQLQTGNNSKLYIIGWHKGDEEVEKNLHKRFGEFRKRYNSEWFHCSEEILEYINENSEMSNTKILMVDGKIMPFLCIKHI